MPTACISAYIVVEPTKLNPAFLNALESASDSGVFEGKSARVLKWFTSIFPPVKLQIHSTGSLSSSHARAFWRTEKIFPR